MPLAYQSVKLIEDVRAPVRLAHSYNTNRPRSDARPQLSQTRRTARAQRNRIVAVGCESFLHDRSVL